MYTHMQANTDAGLLEPLRQAHSEDTLAWQILILMVVFKAITGSLLLVSAASGDRVKLWFRGKLKDS